MMKKICILILLASYSTIGISQTLFTYGNIPVDKEEFLRAYNKNKTPVTDIDKSLKEYLDLYIKFKLKVKAAKDLRLDTLTQLKNDLDNFRVQIEESYLNNEPALNRLIDEAFTRSQKDLHVLHFFIPLGAKAKPEDTLSAYRALADVRGFMKTENNNFEKVSKELTVKYNTIKCSDLGYVTAFTLPYEYENIVYGLNTGETSKPHRSGKGLHVFFLAGDRTSAGRWRVSQILIAFPPGDHSQNFASLKHRADSVYQLIMAGADFAKLAGEISDDKMSYMTGGEIPEFGTGKFELPFETAVFNLSKDGDVSHPFATEFGFHIVKRLKHFPTPSDKNDAVFLSQLKQNVMQDSRVNTAREIFYRDVIKQVGYKKNSLISEADIFRFADTVSSNLANEVSRKIPVYDKVIFSIGKNNIKGADWLNYIRDYKNTAELYRGESNAVMIEKFVTTTALGYYKKNMEEFNPDFRYQMEEFREGNILFEIMERNVWSKAANDSVGLKNYYNENKSKYRWAASANIIIFNCTNGKIADAAIGDLKNGKDWKKIIESQSNTIQADSGRYEISQIPMEKGITPKPGLITSPVINVTDGSASFIKFTALFEPDIQRSFDEARGLVINDYQGVLENQWIAELKKKYPIKVNEAVFKSLLQ